MTETTTQAPTGLRAARKEQAQAREAAKDRHPAGKQAPAKAPAKKAPAKALAAKATKTAGLRWTFPNGKDEFKDGKTQIAPFAHGELAIERSGEKWRAVYRVSGKVVETLAEPGSFGRAYNACTRYAKGAAA